MNSVFLKKLSFKQQLITVFSIGIICLTSISSLVISSLSSRALHTHLMEQGRQLTLSFGSRSKVALLYESSESAQSATQAVMAFPDVESAAIYTRSHSLLFREGTDNSATNTAWSDQSVTLEETENAWYFTAPVLAETTSGEAADTPFGQSIKKEERVGYVKIALGKATLKVLSHRILRDNLLISSGLAAVLLMLLLWVTNRLTNPLKNLADIMRQAESGEKGVRAELGGPRDIQDMEHAFNTMISELESRERSLRKARDSALGMANAKSEFTAMVSHELRTPMNGVLGMIELIRVSGLTAKQEEYVKIARESSEALLLLIDDILDFAKIEAGQMRIFPSNFYVRELAGDILDLLRFQASAKHLDLRLDIAADLPGEVCADSGRIRQVLINLIGNAIKFTDKGSVTLRVGFLATREQHQIIFEIVDTGIGIPDNARDRIFEAFSQIDSSITRKYSGTGLGLSICRQLARLMGGDVEVTSTLGSGSTFTLTLPVSIVAETTGEKSQVIERLAGLRILIVTEDGEYGRRLSDYVTSSGSFARNVADEIHAQDALQLALQQNKPYDIVLIDSLSGMTAGNFAVAISRELDIGPAKILLFGTDADNAVAAQAMRPIAIAPRPVDRADLLDAILAVLGAAPKSALQLSRSGHVSDREIDPQHIVLIAEDNLASQQVAQSMLEQLGYPTLVVDNGEHALDYLQRNEAALVLMDCYMPVLDGFGAATAIRGLRGPQRQVPIVGMTARVSAEDRQRCLTAGMDDVLTKPLSIEELKRVFSQFVKLPSKTASEISAVRLPPDLDLDTSGIDMEVINRIRNYVGDDRFAASLLVFLDDTPGALHTLNKGMEASDTDAIIEASHRLLGGAQHFGATLMSDSCLMIENVAKANELHALPPLLEKLNEQFAKVQRVLLNIWTSIDNSQSVDAAPTLISRPLILVVDDERSSRISIVGILERDNYTIVEAENGRQALELCRLQMPDLILMDAMMPEMDGFNACRSILQLPAADYPPILIITALHDEDSVTKAFDAGATDYIPKPINLLVLRKRVERILNMHSSARQIQQLAYYDQLTKLPNRSLFLQRGGDIVESAAERGEQLAVLFMDLDRFKLVNDTLGHDAGDLLLCAAAKRLKSCIRSSDLIARLGGDEFTVILENIQSPEKIARVAEKICRAFTKPFSIGDTTHHVYTSIGIALYPDNGSDISTLMKRADTAMFRAKAKGGANFQYYEFGMEAEIIRKVELENELRIALDNSQLELHYQPQIDLRSNALRGFEALVRWRHPVRGLVPPGDFIPLAEECGLIGKLGEWVVSRVCSQQREWIDSGLNPFPVSVNVAYSQLLTGDLPNFIQSTLDDAGLPPNLLKLEFTETSLIDTPENAIIHMNRLNALGISLEIDDFGTGYSSLSYLKHLPVDAMKIDRSFINDLLVDEASTAIVAGIISMADKLGLQVVAEGVETLEQLELLREQGCDVGQGYYISRPLPVCELYAWVSRWQQDTREVVS